MPSTLPSDGRTERLAGFVVAAVVAGIVWIGWRPPPVEHTERPLDLAGELSTDPGLEVDSLDNGLRYYLRESDNPTKSVELRLVVDAGSAVEEEDQRGLAHGVEHMAFRGTRRFAHDGLVAYLQSIGMRSGDDLNAYTTEDETVFRLTVPTDHAGALDRAFDILEDWASGVTFDSLDAAQERGIVLAEWRSRRSAGERLDRARDSLLLAGSAYAARPPIGVLPVIERFDARAMRRFYERWYRPDLMAVVAIGDVPRDSLRALVRAHFAPIARPATPMPRPRIHVAPERAPRSVVLTDPEASGATVALWHLAPPPPALRTVGDYRTRVVDMLVQALLDDRLAHVAREHAATLHAASSGWSPIVRPLRAFEVEADVPPEQLASAVDLVAVETERARRWGFTPREIERQRAALLRDAEREVDDDEEPPASAVAEACVANFLRGEPLTSRTARYALRAQLLPQITAADVDAALRRNLDPERRVLVVSAPARARGRLPTDPALRALLQGAIARTDLTRPRDDESARVPLVAEEPEPGRIVDERTIPGVGVTEWTLANGMRVLLKPTSHRAEQILFRAWSPGGASLAADSVFWSAFMSDAIVRANGVGALDAHALGEALDGHRADLTPYVGHDEVRLSGEGSSLEAEELFQLAHLYLTAPRADAAAFARWTRERAAASAERARDPDEVFDDSVVAVLGDHRPRAMPVGVAASRQVDERAALDFYRARFGHGAGFTVVLVGRLSPEQLRPLVERYLASIPPGVAEAPRDAGTRWIAGPLNRVVRQGREPRSTMHLLFTGDMPHDEAAVHALHALRELLAGALEDRLRERLGGTYGVDVAVTTSPKPRWQYALAVEFSTAPAQLDTLTAAALAEIARLRADGPTADELTHLRAALARDARAGAATNEWWADELSSHLDAGWPLAGILDHEAQAKALDAAALRDAARRFIDPLRVVRIARVPER